jgi:hypothetical protein
MSQIAFYGFVAPALVLSGLGSAALKKESQQSSPTKSQ